ARPRSRSSRRSRAASRTPTRSWARWPALSRYASSCRRAPWCAWSEWAGSPGWCSARRGRTARPRPLILRSPTAVPRPARRTPAPRNPGSSVLHGCRVHAAPQTFRNYVSFGRVACQDAGMGADRELLKVLGPQLELLLPELDEKARRLTLGAVARAAGDGGIGAVARLTGASWQTVANGAAELGSGQVAPEGRVRRPGAGRPKLAEADPGLVPALLALVEESVRGDPESPLVWTTKSAVNLSR